MGVYQSRTEPEVSRMSYSEIVPGNIIDSVGKKNVIKYLRKRGGVPTRVKPVQSLDVGGWRFDFRWFSVTTD